MITTPPVSGLPGQAPPASLVQGSDGNLYVTDYSGGSVIKVALTMGI